MAITPLQHSTHSFTTSEEDKDKQQPLVPLRNSMVRNNFEHLFGTLELDTVLNRVRTIFGLNVIDMRRFFSRNSLELMTKIENKFTISRLNMCFDLHTLKTELDEDNPEMATYTDTEKARYNNYLERAKNRISQTETEVVEHTQTSINECALLVKSFLDNAKVLSFKELLEKSDAITKHKKIAETVYLRSPVNIERRKQIDLKILPLDEEIQSMVSTYWNTLPNNESMIAIHAMAENLMKEVYVVIYASCDKIYEQLLKERDDHPFGSQFNLPLKLYDANRQTCDALFDQFKNDLSNSIYHPDTLSTEYNILKAKTMITSLSNKIIRKLLREDLGYYGRDFRKALKSYEEFERTLSFYTSQLESVNRKILDSSDSLEEAKIKEDATLILECEKTLNKWQSTQIDIQKSIDDYSSFLAKWSKREFCLQHSKNDPELYATVTELCKENSFDRSLIRYCKIKWGNVFLTSFAYPVLIDKDIDVDTTQISDPKEYFQSILIARDQEFFSLSKTKQSRCKRISISSYCTIS